MVKRLIIPFILLWGLVGCKSTQTLDPLLIEKYYTLSSDTSLGQTFVAHYDGLNGITLASKPPENSQGTITVHIREAPPQVEELRIVEVPLEEIPPNENFTINFSPIKNSNGNSYYLFLTLNSQSQVLLGSTSQDKYLDGSLYKNNTPEDAQLVFRLSYDKASAALGILGEFLTWTKYILITFVLFILPGYVLSRVLLRRKIAPTWIEKFALASGLSLVIYPLIYLWTDVIGLHLGFLYAWGPPSIAVIILLWQDHSKLVKFSDVNIRSKIRYFTSIENITLICVLILLVFSRFWAIRAIAMPMWGDSYQHTMIAQLLVDNKGLFQSWLPYAEMTTFTYHFGFHSLVAGFHYLSGLSMPLSVLWTGQILNILAVISLIPLAMRIHHSKWSAIFAVVLAGLLFNMPMFYTNWGRYTQLTGQVILPAVVLLSWFTLESKKVGWKLYIALWVSLCGLALTHYRVLTFALGALIALYILHFRKTEYISAFVKLLIMTSGAFALFLPNFVNILSGKLLTIIQNNLKRSLSLLSTPNQLSEPIGVMTTYLPAFAWIGLFAVFLWGIWKRNYGVFMVTIWMLVVYLVANPHLLKLPGTHLITNFAIFIAAYIPAGILLGGFFGWLVDILKSFRYLLPSINIRIPSQILVAILVIILSLLGTNLRFQDLDQNAFALATVPDIRAAKWINQNIPKDGKFLVNSFYVPKFSAIVGSDGGWWLPILVNRPTMVPPLNYTAEQGPSTDYRLQINNLTDQILFAGVDSPEVRSLLQEYGVTHIYIGQRRGSVNSPGELLPPAALLSSSHLNPIYHQDFVWIFEILEYH